MNILGSGDGSLIRFVVRDKSHYSDICRDRRGRNRERSFAFVGILRSISSMSQATKSMTWLIPILV